MKRFICITLTLLALVSCLTACNFTQNIASKASAECTPKVEEMLTALAEDHNSEAKALMHPKAAENADAAIAQMNAYLSGREVGAVEQKSINVKSSAGTAGKSKQEQVVYQVTMNDGDVIYLNVLYLSDKDGEGFTSFQLVLGAV